MNLLNDLLGIGRGLVGEQSQPAQHAGFVPYANPVQAAHTIPRAQQWAPGTDAGQISVGQLIASLANRSPAPPSLLSGVPVNQASIGTSNTLAPMYAPQGGYINPGYTPLQNSGFGPAGNPQLGAFQPYQQAQQPQVNPQASGYSWNQ